MKEEIHYFDMLRHKRERKGREWEEIEAVINSVGNAVEKKSCNKTYKQEDTAEGNVRVKSKNSTKSQVNYRQYV